MDTDDTDEDQGYKLGHCTEILGYESVAEKMDSGDSSNFKIRNNDECRRVTRAGREEQLKIFPPFLTTLNVNGRPRFVFKKVAADNGRLSISMVPKDEEILRCTRDGGRLRMWIVRSNDDDGGDCVLPW